MRSILLSFFLALLPCFASASADTESIRSSAQLCVDALLKSNFEDFCSLVHPRIVRLSGGKDALIKLTKANIENMKKEDFVIESVTIGEPEDPVDEAGWLVSKVPQTISIQTPKGLLKSESYMLAISEDSGLNWTFIDLGPIDLESFHSVFPELKHITLPEKERPVLTPN